ncbi:MAG: 5'(3')-deoxyribonucleotidase [Bacteroidota bacterium]|nr:5'(3')-deoxyribonucleotidase [Bacteroidota bacterium]
MKRLLIDMDEVIADTTGGMVAWYKEKFGGDIDYAKMLEGQSLVKGFPAEHQAIIRQQFFEPGFFRNLPVMDDSVAVVEELNKKYEVFIVSAATEFPNSLTEKYYWLMEHFPFFHWQQLVLCGVKSMIEADIMIDDHVRHLKNFRGKPWLFTAPHNLNEEGFERIDGWKDAAMKLL